MKWPLLLTALLCPVLLAAPPKGSARTPAATAETAAAPGSSSLDTGVKLRIDMFFKLLKDGKKEEAFAKLFEGSTLAKEQPELLTALASNTDRILEKSGAIESAALLRVRSAGTTLKEITYICNCRKQPVRWTLYAYNGDGRWQILDTDANLDLASFFEPEKTGDR